jgi:hypothetical protein
LGESAADLGLYLWDLGQGEAGRYVAVVRITTVDRWRKVPRRIVEEYQAPVTDADDQANEDDGEN